MHSYTRIFLAAIRVAAFLLLIAVVAMLIVTLT